ncbi:hypothetical protein QBC40DRAFT_349731 [Triangularia verruculosa]|uniref:DH domain-containing protein n=1 Tax=Triangularia verruculosa TaxID=2587418 RepID=A0AAN6XEL4_9PEZI|nr:hypothetical protein QBC40DRAFT_349731 [Triangularia verruculosa]
MSLTDTHTVSLSSVLSSGTLQALTQPDRDKSTGYTEEKARVERTGDWCALDKIHAMDAIGAMNTVIQEQDLEKTVYIHQDTTEPELFRDQPPASKPTKPFQKWIKTLHKRALRRQELFDGGNSTPCCVDMEERGSMTWDSGHYRHSSDSSFNFVSAVKSASISLTNVSVLTRSRKNTIRSSRGHSRTDRSSRASVSGARLSEDSFCQERQVVMDPAVIERSLQRRRILEELISTEESYIGDVRFLMNVYVTILASLPTLPVAIRSSINQNLTDIVELHEEMLGELHRAVPHSEYSQLDVPLQVPPVNQAARGHQRWRSLDAVPEDKDGVAWLRDVPGLLAEPQTVAEVAKIFKNKMNRFFIYEEYGAKYELMIKDVASAHRTMPGWQSYQKGLEVLAASVGSIGVQGDHSTKKSLTIGDLLVKPIQRVCKYPLLFSELLKHTPVVDCPYSHMEIENTLARLREATAEINRATDDPRVRTVLERTWILQDRLAFPNQQLDATTKNRIRSFGHIQLCGALHVCWQSKEGVSGQYMVALLYKEWFCLATASKIDQVYTIQACIALSNIKVEEVDNGRGLQCHTAPYSWKIVFLCDNQLYELILTACTPKEELEWRTRLNSQSLGIPDQDLMQPAIFSSLSLDIKTLGTVFRKPGTIARRISIHRATTVGPRSPLCQVILKNTSVIKDAPTSSYSSQINRSQSLLATNHRIPVLAPSRGERARLEALMSDVWTRDILPFPGITARSRSEHLVRSSASSVMRKLSVVSIASSFTKRSASLASLQKSVTTEEEVTARNDREGGVVQTTTVGATVTASVREKSEDACMSLLSVIPDEAERSSSLLLATGYEQQWEATTTEAFAATTVKEAFGNGSAETAIRTSVVYNAGGSEIRPCTPIVGVLQSSTNSSRRPSLQKSHRSEASLSRENLEKENRFASPPGSVGKTSSRSQKLASRWAKVGVLHREAVVGIRSFIFR